MKGMSGLDIGILSLGVAALAASRLVGRRRMEAHDGDPGPDAVSA